METTTPTTEAAPTTNPNENARLRIVESDCQFSSDHVTATVVVESLLDDFPTAIEQLGSNEARHFALGFAARAGLSQPGINGTYHPYAVNRAGVPLDKVRGADGKPLPHKNPEMQPARYRADIPITRKLI